jgi:hypothetical protein
VKDVNEEAQEEEKIDHKVILLFCFVSEWPVCIPIDYDLESLFLTIPSSS